jgi:hypothetical protein
MADNLPHSSADVMESGSLNLPEHSGPHRPVMGLLYLYIRVGLPNDSPLQVLHSYAVSVSRFSSEVHYMPVSSASI